MSDSDDMYTHAEPPRRWVCVACGKTSPNRAGFDRLPSGGYVNVGDPGWDESCFLRAVLCEPNPEATTELAPKWRTVKTAQ